LQVKVISPIKTRSRISVLRCVLYFMLIYCVPVTGLFYHFYSIYDLLCIRMPTSLLLIDLNSEITNNMCILKYFYSIYYTSFVESWFVEVFT